MGSYQIAEVARRSGFSASALRYYEDVGLVPPARRTGAGYRIYDDDSLARLAFISRAKQLGCTLPEITALVTAWEGQRCEPVQAQLRELVAAKMTEAECRIAELDAFTAQLRQAAATLGQHTPHGPCDDGCGCTTPPAPASAEATVKLTAKAAEQAEPPIVCTLAASDMSRRVADWQVALSTVVSREPIHNGMRLTLSPDASLAVLADLAAAEQKCCSFLRFAITVDASGAALEVTAPADAHTLVESLFGEPS